MSPCADPDSCDTASQVIDRVLAGGLPQRMADHKLRAQEGCLTAQGSERRPPQTAPDTLFALVSPGPRIATNECLWQILGPAAPALVLKVSGVSIMSHGDLWQRGPQSLGPASVPAPLSFQLLPGFLHMELSLGFLLLPLGTCSGLSFPF